MKNFAFRRLLEWQIIVLPILTASLIHFSLKRLGECTFWTCFSSTGQGGAVAFSVIYENLNEFLPQNVTEILRWEATIDMEYRADQSAF